MDIPDNGRTLPASLGEAFLLGDSPIYGDHPTHMSLIAEAGREERPYGPVYGSCAEHLVITDAVPPAGGLGELTSGVSSLGVVNLDRRGSRARHAGR